MFRPSFIIVWIACAVGITDTALAQTAGQLRRDRLRGSLDVQNARIGEQRVQRQTEIMRLEEILRSVEDRMNRLERQAMANSQPPVITMAEAEAAVALADAQLKESERLHSEGQVSDLALARHRLDSVRALGQLEAAKFAHADRLIVLELEVLYAERKLNENTQQQRQLERFVAKGYSSVEGLKRGAYDVALAEKHLRLARLRLAAQRRAAGGANPQTLLGDDAVANSDDAVPNEPEPSRSDAP